MQNVRYSGLFIFFQYALRFLLSEKEDVPFPSQHQIILRQLWKRRKRLGNALEGVVDEFSAFVLAADDSAALAKNVFFVVDDCGVLAEFADAGQVARNVVFHDNILYGSVILCFTEIYYTA